MKKVVLAVCLAVCSAAPLLFLSCNGASDAPKENTITVWHWMTDREETFFELSRRYKGETGVEVVFQLYAPLHNYEAKVQIGAQTGTLPDIFGVLGDVRDLARFIKAGHLANFSEALGSGKGSWKDQFFPEALVNTRFKKGNRLGVSPGYYGIPLDISTIPMIYNKNLFRKAGLDPEKPPATWPEFIEAGKKLRQIGVSGFVSGWSEGWLIFSLATDLAHNLMGEEKVMDTFRGKVPYTDSQWVQVLAAFAAMQKGGFADPSLVSLKNRNAEQKFASERSGMTLNGSWAVNVFSKMNPNLDYAPFRPPALNPDNPRPVWGGAGSVFSVNAKSPKKEKAIQFLKWFTEPAQASYFLQQTQNLPAVKEVGTKTAPILQSFASLMEGSIHPNRFKYTEYPRVIEVIHKGIQSILIAEKTPEKVAAEIQKMKDKVLREQQ